MGFTITGPRELPTFTGDKTITGNISVGGRIAVTDNQWWGSGVTGSNAAAYAGVGNSGRGFDLGSTRNLSWFSGTLLNSTLDTTIGRAASGSIQIGGIGNGQLLGIKQLTELTTIAAAATTDTAIQMPAAAIILGVSVRVTVVIPTATNFTVGDSGSAARFSTAAVSVTANSTDPGTKAGAYYNASALSVRITPDGTPAANTGRVRVTIMYIDVTPPTS